MLDLAICNEATGLSVPCGTYSDTQRTLQSTAASKFTETGSISVFHTASQVLVQKQKSLFQLAEFCNVESTVPLCTVHLDLGNDTIMPLANFSDLRIKGNSVYGTEPNKTTFI